MSQETRSAGGWPWSANYLGPPCDPVDGWAITDGRLHCGYSRRITNNFLRNKDANWKAADARWTQWFGSLNAGPFNAGPFGKGGCYHPPMETPQHCCDPCPNRAFSGGNFSGG